MIPAFRRNAGFSLVELSIIVVIASLLATAGMQQYRTWRDAKISGDTESRKNMVSNALTLFLTNYGRLPCPADPLLAPDQPSAGYEACPATFGGPFTETNGGVIRVRGFRDTDQDPDGGTGCLATMPPTGDDCDPVLIGAIPYAALGISAVDATDGWGNKFTYAITEYQTSASANRGGVFPPGSAPVFNDQRGVIRVREMSPQKIEDPPASGNYRFTGVINGPINSANSDYTENTADQIDKFLLVVVSHGRDGKGAYTYSGRLVTPCPAVTVARDAENCNGDAVFIKADAGTHAYMLRPGPAYFDDAFTIYRIRRDSDKWVATNANSMKNKTEGRVGIGTGLPMKMLDVGGNLKLDNLKTVEYCSNTPNLLTVTPDDTHCFKPAMLTGTITTDANTSSAHCGSPTLLGIMTAIDGADPWKTNCASKMNMTGITPGSCPPGQYLTGVDATGAITCALP